MSVDYLGYKARAGAFEKPFRDDYDAAYWDLMLLFKEHPDITDGFIGETITRTSEPMTSGPPPRT